MEKKINWLEKPLFVYLFGLFFLIYRTAFYFSSFDFFVFTGLLLLYCLLTFLLYLLLKTIRLAKYAAILIIVFWFLNLFLLFFFELIITQTGLFQIRIRHFLLISSFIIISIIYTRHKIDNAMLKKVNRAFNIFILILLVVVLVSGEINFQYEKHHEKSIATEAKKFNIHYKHDIVWILMDEYAAPACLRSQFHFQDDLVDSLRNKGFYVFDSLPSRIDVTLFSINSLFNLDDSFYCSSYMYAGQYLKKAAWLTALEKQGYQCKILDFLDIGKQNKLAAISFFPTNYINQLFNGTLLNYVYSSMIEKETDIDDYNNSVITCFKDYVNTNKNLKPSFTWIHLLIPHAPFYRNKNGVLLDSKNYNFNQISEKKNKLLYLDYMQYGNAVVLDLIKHIPNWQNKTIIISGDHGARLYLKDKDPRRFATFCAIYAPDEDSTKLKGIRYLQQIPFFIR